MTDTHVSYAPGTWTLLARGGRYLLVDATPADQPIGLLWSALESAGDLAGVLETVTRALPDAGYCLFQVVDGEVHLAQHSIAATLDGAPIDGGATPVIVRLPATGGTIVAAPTPAQAGPQIPIEGGVVGAGAVVLEWAVVRPNPVTNTQIWADVPQLDQALAAPTPVAAALDLAVRPADRAPAPGTTVLAAICLNGHYSGAHAPTCRVCGSLMPAQTPRTVARPTLGALVLQDDTRIDLDRGAILGRAPQVPQEAEEPPHLVNLAAYGRDVSRQHAEVIVRGWSVFVRDLGSANGTRIHDPSGQITTLETGVAVPLLPDSLIEIAEVTTIRYRTD